jgi:hypothetical protein
MNKTDAIDSPPWSAEPSQIEFTLWYRDILIGNLSFDPHEGIWQFAYSEEFKKKADLRPLFEFPDLDKIYRSKALWTSFRLRIPSVKRDEIAQKMKEKSVSPSDIPGLLKLFGRRTASDPFELIPA